MELGQVLLFETISLGSENIDLSSPAPASNVWDDNRLWDDNQVWEDA